MEELINRMIGILNRYSIEDVNKLYRDKEVELEITSFSKHPEVKWSELLKKKMIQAAKRKRIAPGRIKYLKDQIGQLNNYSQEEHLEVAIEDIKRLINKLTKTDIQLNDIVLIHIEFSDFKTIANIELYGAYKTKWYENELGRFELKFDSSGYWKEINTTKFSGICEQLEIIEIDEEEYPLLFIKIRELRVFNILKEALMKKEIMEWIYLNISKAKIEIGIHDDEFHIIRAGTLHNK